MPRAFEVTEDQIRLAWKLQRESKDIAVYYEGLIPITPHGHELQDELADKHGFLVEREKELRRAIRTLRHRQFYQKAKEASVEEAPDEPVSFDFGHSYWSALLGAVRAHNRANQD